ncbi:glycosyltransferase [Candidatus Sumerlaeota bacterium]|nr:glycosyltransferase [Candidatus Sumerlaeota bacterium]
MADPLCSVVIVAWNRRRELKPALDSIFRQTIAHRIEVIVVDNGSEDDTLEFLQHSYADAIQDERLRVYAFERNEGASHGRNAGIRLARAKHVCFLDSDAEIISDNAIERCLERLAQGLERAVGGMIWFDRERTRGFCFGGYITHDGHVDCLRTQTERENPMFLSTCFSVWEKTLLEELRGFDPFYFWGIEDVDFSVRAYFNAQRGRRRAATQYHVLDDIHVLHEMASTGRKYEAGNFEKTFMDLERQRLYLVLSYGGLFEFFRNLLRGPFRVKRFSEVGYRMPFQFRHQFLSAWWFPLIRLIKLPVDWRNMRQNHLARSPHPRLIAGKNTDNSV